MKMQGIALVDQLLATARRIKEQVSTMTTEQVFSIANLAAMFGWLLLACAPRWVVTRWFVLSGLVPLLLSAAYLLLVLLFIGTAEGGFNSLDGVKKLFSNDWVLLAGWIHYLAFDLLVGTWEVRDSQANGISHWFVLPCLLFTFLFGPIGFLIYFIVRSVIVRRGMDQSDGA